MATADRRTIHYIQWIRAVGAVAIVLLHAFVTVHIALGPQVVGPTRMMVEEAISIVLTRWAVPVFFMVSGGLMLDPDREMGWGKVLRHVWRLGFVLLTFGFAFCLSELVVDQGSFQPAQLPAALIRLLDQDSWDHMWYVYQLLGFYLMTPFIRPWVAQASQKEYGRVAFWACIVLLGTRAASMFMPIIMYYGVSIPHCFAYYLIGPYVMRYLQLNRRWVVAGLLSLATTLVLTLGFGFENATEPIRIFIAPYSVLVFLLFKRYLDIPLDGHPAIAVLADYSFGIYLIHTVFQHLLAMNVDLAAYPAVLVDVVLTVVPLALSVASVWLLRLIPGFKDKL